MSNKSIINRILEIIEAFEHGQTSASAVAASVALHEPALATIPGEARDKLHALSFDVIMQDISTVEAEMKIQTAKGRFRAQAASSTALASL